MAFGPESPFRISKIVLKEVLNAEVPVRESCLFRVRAKIVRTSSADDIACHFCPATGLRSVFRIILYDLRDIDCFLYSKTSCNFEAFFRKVSRCVNEIILRNLPV